MGCLFESLASSDPRASCRPEAIPGDSFDSIFANAVSRGAEELTRAIQLVGAAKKSLALFIF